LSLNDIVERIRNLRKLHDVQWVPHFNKKV